MSITNLLAQGFNPLPAEIQQNALMAGQQMQERRMRNALLQQQMQAAQEERAAQQRNALMMQEAINAIPSPQMQASQQALAGGGGPTVANAARMPAVDPRLQALHGLMQASGGKLVSPVDYLKTAMPEPEKPRDVVVGNTLVRTQGGKAPPLFTAEKPEAMPPGMRMGANGPEWIPGYLEGKSQVARAGAQGNVTMLAPIPVQMPDGTVGLVQPGNRPGVAPQVLTGPDGKPLVKPGESSKPLNPKIVSTISDARDNASSITMLAESFKPEFASKGVAGLGADLQIKAGAVLGMDKDSVNWWKNYRKMAELVERHAMFGASLTVGEKDSWASADISPGMDEAVIKRNLDTRAAIAKKVLENAVADAVDAGHNPERIAKIAARGGAASVVDNQGAKPAQQPQGGGKTVVRTGTMNGRKVVQYSDGTTAYAD